MFYEEGVKYALAQLGLTKESAGWLMPAVGALGGAGKGALVGGGIGGITGAVSADEGQGWEGFKRGLGRGALAGGAVGGLGGLVKGIGTNQLLGRSGQRDLYQRARQGMQTPDDIALGNLTRSGSILKGLAGGIAGATGE